MADNDAHSSMLYHAQIVTLQQLEEAILTAQYEVIDITPHSILPGYYIVTQQADSPIPLPKDSDWHTIVSRLEPTKRDENFKVLGRFRRGEFSLHGANAEILIQKVCAQKGFLCIEEDSVLKMYHKDESVVTKECLVVVRAHAYCAQQCRQFALLRSGLVEDSHTVLRAELDTNETAYLVDQIGVPTLNTLDI